MKLVSFSAADGIVCPGILSEETNTVLDLSRSGFTSTLDVIKQGGLTMAGADKFPLDEVKLHAPLPNPPTDLCHRPELSRPRQRIGDGDTDNAGGFLQTRDGNHRPGRTHRPA